MATQLPTPDDDEQIDPNVAAEEEELSAGNNRLALILGGILLVLILGYVLLPKGNGSGLASVTPSFMLDDAAVTATAPTAADSIAAGLKKAPADGSASVAAAPSNRPVTNAGTPLPAAAAPAEENAIPAPTAAATPEPEAAPAPAPAPEPAAPSTENLTGRILDENGKPLIGATVFLKGSSKATSTDANGNYSLEVPGGAENTLVYGYGGYQDEEVRARGNQPVNVTLTPSPSSGGKKRRR